MERRPARDFGTTIAVAMDPQPLTIDPGDAETLGFAGFGPGQFGPVGSTMRVTPNGGELWSGGSEHTLRVGVIESVLHSWLIPWVEHLRLEFPALELEL